MLFLRQILTVHVQGKANHYLTPSVIKYSSAHAPLGRKRAGCIKSHLSSRCASVATVGNVQRLVTDHDTRQPKRRILYFGNFQNSGWKGELPSLKEGGNGQRGVVTDAMCRFVGPCVGASMCVGCTAVHLWEAEARVHTAVRMHLEARS